MRRLGALSTLIFATLCLSLNNGSAIAGPSATGQSQSPGAPLGPDPFQISFDEFGTGFYRVFNPATGQYGPMVNDPGTLVDGFLRFLVPEAVGLGDVGIAGPQEGEACSATSVGLCSDGLRFIFEGAAITCNTFRNSRLAKLLFH